MLLVYHGDNTVFDTCVGNYRERKLLRDRYMVDLGTKLRLLLRGQAMSISRVPVLMAYRCSLAVFDTLTVYCLFRAE